MIPTPPDARTTVFLLFVAALVAILARRLRLPTSAGLLIAGAALTLAPGWTATVGLDRRTLFTLLLPPLIFEGALNLKWRELRRDLNLVTALTTFGVIAAAAVASALMHFGLRWAWTPALYFGVLIAATDPIAVLANFKELGVDGRPRLLVEAESLLNDGTAVVMFGLVVLMTGHPGASDLGLHLGIAILRDVGGAIAIGLAVGWLLVLLAGRASDPLTETTFTAVAAYGSYFLADSIGATGILASVAAGLVMGNVGMRANDYVSPRGKEVAEAIWDFAAFVANSLVFLLMGMYVARTHVLRHPGLLVAGIAVGLVARFVTVYGICGLFAKTRAAVPALSQHLLFWGGQRGGLSLVLALGLVTSAVPQASQVSAATVGVVAFSILVQGTTFRPLMRFLERKSAPLS